MRSSGTSGTSHLRLTGWPWVRRTKDTPLDDADVLWEEESCDEVQDESSIGEGLEYYTFALDDDDDEWDDEFVYHEDEDDLEYDEPSEYDDEDDMEPMEE
ncbi:hypothetical protein AaE_003236 [Aphanomyces astaci]|uniref:Uncharacterized protein n=1 Tax=Aphanomyces astaci TaxID=112090 RepID=A0A6A5AS57_APHAT|nr:hypothetical protein AaE_003236 [Aphanomyces astaci]